jgi:sec-independent protein translocase protein TatA
MEASLLFIQRMGPWGIVLIVLVVLLLFGGKKIPELMKGLGKGVKEFKDATNNPDGNENSKGEVNEKNN